MSNTGANSQNDQKNHIVLIILKSDRAGPFESLLTPIL